MKRFGLPENICNGLRGCYHLYFDPQLDTGIAVLRRITCSCKSWMERKIPWNGTYDNLADQPIFTYNDKCKCIDVFDRLKDLIIFNIQNKVSGNEWTMNVF